MGRGVCLAYKFITDRKLTSSSYNLASMAKHHLACLQIEIHQYEKEVILILYSF